MSELVEDNAVVIRQISEYQQEDANCKVLIDRYKSLTSQYKANLQRFDFISKGEKDFLKMISAYFVADLLIIMTKVMMKLFKQKRRESFQS